MANRATTEVMKRRRIKEIRTDISRYESLMLNSNKLEDIKSYKRILLKLYAELHTKTKNDQLRMNL
jgi:hypothetical protein